MTSLPRARLPQLGLVIGTLPSGPLDAITDVAGVGQVTLIEDSPRVVRSGVTPVATPGPSTSASLPATAPGCTKPSGTAHAGP
jgi:L-aminopeptidase/D-esterase-like protein